MACGDAAAGWVATAAAPGCGRQAPSPIQPFTNWRRDMNRTGTQRRNVLGGITAALVAIAVGPAAAQADKPLRIGFSMARTGMLAERHAVAGEHLRAVARAGQRARRHGRRRHEAQGRVRRLRRPVQARAGGAHLREADHRRQGRPAARAVGHAVPHLDRAGAREVQVPDGRQHRGLGGAAPGQARLHLVPDVGDPGPHRRRADRAAEGSRTSSRWRCSPTCCRSPRRSRTSSSPS